MGHAPGLPTRPGYFALRLGADLASAARGDTLHFGYREGELEITDRAENTVAVATPPSARERRGVTQVRITHGASRLPFDGTAYCALFWSESSVEKFLLPYYVSAAGPHAFELLHAINHAFYAYDTDRAVCALAFRFPTRARRGLVQLWDTLDVVYLEDGELRGEPLLRYVATLPQRPMAPFPASPPSRGGSPVEPDGSATLIDAQGAREVAEYVSGLRGHRVRVYATEEPGGLVPLLGPDRLAGAELLFDAYAPAVRPERPQVEVALEVEGSGWHPLEGIGGGAENVPDAAFWGDGAVSLLMLPYYASVQGEGAPWYLAVLMAKWAGWIPAHVTDPGSLRAEVVEAEDRMERLWSADASSAESPSSDVYATIHLPRSEYVDLTTADPFDVLYLENRTWLLTADAAYPLVAPGERLVPRRALGA